MVSLSRSQSLAVLAFCTSALAAPAPAPASEEITLPIGYAPPGFRPAWVGPKINYHTLTVDELSNQNGTVAPPSANLVGRGLKSRGPIGEDNRELFLETGYPYSAMGKIEWSNGVFCSGALVGPRHVATAKHCAPSGEENVGVSVRFMPAFDQGERLGGAGVTDVISLAGYSVGNDPVTSCDWKEDWAIFILNSDLGNQHGYLGALLVGDEDTGKPDFSNYGYPGDLANGARPYRSTGNTIHPGPYTCDAYGPYESDADISGGQSGGPIWKEDAEGTPFLYAVVSGTSSTHSIFSGGDNLLKFILSTREDWP